MTTKHDLDIADLRAKAEAALRFWIPEFDHALDVRAHAEEIRRANGATLALLDRLAAAEAELAQRKAPRPSTISTIPCEGCGKFSSIYTAACDHCDYEDK